MKILKFWFVFCTLFCVYSLLNQSHQRYEVDYLAISNESQEEQQLLICRELSDFDFKKTKYKLSQLRAHLYNHFSTSEYYQDYKLAKKLILDRIKTGSYLIFNGLLCISPKDLEKRSMIKLFLTHLKNGIEFFPAFFTFENRTADFIKITKDYENHFNQLVVLKKEHPYSDCRKNDDRFGCLNECFKRRFRLSRYFYEGNENGFIYLSTFANRSIEKSEKNCLGECWRENCKMIQMFPIHYFDLKESKTTLKARPKLKKIEYWAQFIGLVCSFANVSFNQFVSIVIKFATSRVKRRKVKIALICLKWTILFLSLAYCCYLYTTMILKHQAKEKEPDQKEMTRNQIKQKSIRLAISIDVRKSLKRSGFFDLNNLKMTMPEIERN